MKHQFGQLIVSSIVLCLCLGCTVPSALGNDFERVLPAIPLATEAPLAGHTDQESPTDFQGRASSEATSFPTAVPTIPDRSVRQAAFMVDAGQSVNPFSNELLGIAMTNWEHSWGKSFPGDVPGLAAILKAANIGLIRYAGGLWANWVGWERVPQRTPHTEWVPDPSTYAPQFQGEIDQLTYSFHYGQDEIDSLARLSLESGAKIMMQVNVANDDPEMWADLVHYTNVEHDYGFTYWELGNEFDLECRDESEVCVDPDSYEARARAYVDVLRSVDPSVVTVGGVPASAHAFFGANDYSGETTELSPWLYAGRDAGVQSLSYHWYTDCYFESTDNVLTYAWGVPYTAWQQTYSREWSKTAPERVETEVLQPVGKSLSQGITEMNIDACDFARAPINSNHLNAVWMADVIGRLGYNGLDYMTWYSAFGSEWQGYPAIATVEDYYPFGGGSLYLRPTYYTLFLLGNFFGDQYIQSSSPDEERVSLWASTDSRDPGALKLIVVNISDSPVTGPIALVGYTPQAGKKYTLSNPNPLSLAETSNGPDHGTTINGLKLTPENIVAARSRLEEDAPLVSIVNGQIDEQFPPYSVTAIVLERTELPPAVISRLHLPFLAARR